MRWKEVCADPNLQDLPYKIELNEWGIIEMSPASIRHVRFQKRIEKILDEMLREGESFSEFPVETSDNVKAPDVVWISEERLTKVENNVSSSIAPEICVEVLSPENTLRKMMNKKNLYLERGAIEFWLCDENGNMSFYSQKGQLENSEFVPEFPKQVEI